MKKPKKKYTQKGITEPTLLELWDNKYDEHWDKV